MFEILSIIFLALMAEIVDSGIGMMYGTLLCPLLISAGYDPLLVVPSVLISQALGGAIATVRHHKYRNAYFEGLSKDTKVVLAIVIPGLFACLIGVFVALSVPRYVLKTYIGLLVIAMGFLCIRPYTYRFAWWKMCSIGILSAFNKAFTGGGFGPVTSTGKIIAGLNSRVSVATTTYAEVPICLISVFTWLVALHGNIDWTFPLYLSVGAFIGGLIGPYITSKTESEKLKKLVGLLAVILGIWTLLKVFI